MRTPLQIIAVVLMTLIAAGAFHAQVANPMPAPVEKRGLAVEIADVVRLPDTRGLRPLDQDVTPAGWARVNFVRDLPDGRRFANDSRGLLYLLDRNNQPSVYANVGARLPARGLQPARERVHRLRLPSGVRAQRPVLHRARASARRATRRRRTSSRPGSRPADVTYHNVITEWHATNPAANTFEGTRRELLRVGAHRRRTSTHPMGDVEFNPTAKPGSPDYGLLYTSGSDLGFSNGGGPNANNPGQTQRLDSVITAILRIDPRSPSVSEGHEGARRLHDSAGQQVRRRRRSEDARRDLRLRLPQRAPAVLGPHRRDDVRVRHRHEPHRRSQHRPQRRELRLDEARGLLGERHDPARRRAQPAVRAAGRRAGRPAEGRVHLSGRDLRPQRRPGDHAAASPTTAASPRCAASSSSATSVAAGCSPPTSRR